MDVSSKRQHLTIESAKFLISGAINTLLTLAIYYLLHLALPYQIAFATAYALGIGLSYWLNSAFVFKTPMTWKGLMAYPLVYLVQYALSAVLLGFFVEYLGVPKEIGPVFVVVITVPVTFLMTRWILRRPRSQAK